MRNTSDDDKKISEEEIQELLKTLEEMNKDNNNSKKKKVSIVITPFLFKSKFLSILFTYALTLFCFVGVLGITEFIKINIALDVLLITACIVMLEYSAKILISKRFPQLVLKTMGTIIPVINFVIAIAVMSCFEKSFFGLNEYTMIAFAFVFLMVRAMIMNAVKRKVIQNKMFIRKG